MVVGSRLLPSSPATASTSAVPKPLPRTVVAFGRGQTAANVVATKKAAAERAKAPPPSAAPRAPNVMRRSGSLGHLVTSMSAIQQQPNANSNDQRNACKCTEAAETMAFLEGVYVQNLQTQIEVLELENAYLRGSSERGALFVRQPNRRISSAAALQNGNSHRRRRTNGAEATEAEAAHYYAYQPRAYATADAIRTESEDEEQNEGEEEQKRRMGRGQKPITMPKRRVAFVTDRRPPSPLRSRRSHGVESSSSADEAVLSVDEQQNFETDDFGTQNGTRRQRKKLASYDDGTMAEGTKGSAGISPAALEDERRRRHAVEQRLDTEQLRAEEAERHLRDVEEKSYGEKRSLLAENAELQRRLDELTPKLAEQEAKMIALEEQRDETNVRLKATLKQMNTLQNNLADRTRESRQMETDRERSVQRLQRQVDELSRELDATRAREETMNMELDRAKSRLTDEEQRNQREMLAQQLTEQEQRSKVEARLIEAQQSAELANAELELARERLAKEQETVRTLGAKLRERQIEDEQRGSARLRVQRELEAVQSMSQMLASENKGLREEKGAMEEKLNELRQRLHSKDTRVHRLAELLSEFLEKYRQSAQRARHQIGRQTEECQQLEQIVDKIRQTAAAAPFSAPSPHAHAAASATTTTSGGSSTRTTGGGSTTRRSKTD